MTGNQRVGIDWSPVCTSIRRVARVTETQTDSCQKSYPILSFKLVTIAFCPFFTFIFFDILLSLNFVSFSLAFWSGHCAVSISTACRQLVRRRKDNAAKKYFDHIRLISFASICLDNIIMLQNKTCDKQIDKQAN